MKLEVLSPARDFECLKSAIFFGADSIYLGGEIFGMRACAANFDEQCLKKAVDLCHSNGVKLYLTCNTVPTNEEVAELPQFLDIANKVGIDALIVADIGIMFEILKIAPNIPIHISTQVGVMNYKTANVLYELGAKRIVLAREMSLKDIETIRKNVPDDLEIEVFVHGSTCMSFSGRCLLSQYLTGRDANRGQCAQPCRWKYSLMEEKRKGEFFPIFEENGWSYILNSKDLCLIEYLDKLAKVGVNCFKIEGRAKSSYYVSVVTNAYKIASNILKKALEKGEQYLLPNWVREELNKVSHRHYNSGFIFSRPKQGQYYKNGGYIRNFKIVGIVENCSCGYLFIKQKNEFSVGNLIEILQPSKKPIPLKIDKMLDENKNLITSANKSEMFIYIKCNLEIEKGSILRKKEEAF